VKARAAAGPALAVFACIALACARIAPLAKYPIGFDGTHTYLPMARRVLDEGFAFLANAESLRTAPLAFLWPALLGADGTAVRWANLALFCATIAMAALAVRAQVSLRAGLVAALLLAISPTLQPFIIDVATEAPYIFFVGAWILAVSRGWVIAGAVALAAATLTRPAAMYFAPAMAVVFFLLRERRLAAMHLAATAIVALWILRNAVVFGFPAVATGAGTALFLGVNPLVDGFDPTYYGLIYDEGAAAQMPDHLSIAADRLLAGIALTEVRDTPWPILAQMAAHKALAFVFVTAADNSGPPVGLLRGWRVALVVFALGAIFLRRRSPFVIALAAMCAYMVAVYTPVLYHFRYSVGALDLPLTVLAAIGVADAFAAPRRAALALAATILLVGGAVLQAANPRHRSPSLERIPYATVWSRLPGTIAEVRVENGERVGPATFALEPHGAIEFPVRDAPRFHPWDVFMVQLELGFAPAAHARDCDAVAIRYRKPDGAYEPGRVRRVTIPPDGRMHGFVVGAAAPLAINHEGVMRLEFDCAFPATVELGKIAIAAPRRAVYYREKYLREHP